MEEQRFYYKAQVLNIVDGDTIDVSIDLGFDIRIKKRVRVYGINAPEKNTNEGVAAKKFTQDRLAIGSFIYIKTIKSSQDVDEDDKYGRLLGVIFFGEKNDCLNKLLLETGNAIVFMQGKEKYW